MESKPLEHSWRFYQHPADAWEAMYKECAKAKSSIEFEQYILEDDEVGKRFLELFIAKAAARVKVFVLCDMFGSISLLRSPLVRQLKSHGGAFHLYRPIGARDVFMPWRWFPRTHTKTLLIDSSVAFTGGVCLDERMRDWRDTQVRFTGSAIAEVRAAFDALEASRGGRLRCYRYPETSDRSFVYVQNLPRLSRNSIYLELMHAISRAQKHIFIATAYFAPNTRFLKLLKEAADRKVELYLLLPERSDLPLADYLCLTYVPRLLKAGVRVFYYQKTVMHSKLMIADDNWATVGSTNMDVISFFHNREANLIITDPQAVSELKRQFWQDLRHSTEMTWKGWKELPLWKKWVGYCAHPVKWFFMR